jgi:hypothetical protein
MIKLDDDAPHGTYELMESDPGSNNDDKVGAVILNPGDRYAFRNINRFVDGSNDRAEFYVQRRCTGNCPSFGGTVNFYD